MKLEAILNSMTPGERGRPEILDTRRRGRIARGSGTTPLDVDDLLERFTSIKELLL